MAKRKDKKSRGNEVLSVLKVATAIIAVVTALTGAILGILQIKEKLVGAPEAPLRAASNSQGSADKRGVSNPGAKIEEGDKPNPKRTVPENGGSGGINNQHFTNSKIINSMIVHTQTINGREH